MSTPTGKTGITLLKRMSTSEPGIIIWLESMKRMSPFFSFLKMFKGVDCTLSSLISTRSVKALISALGAGSMAMILPSISPSDRACAVNLVE